MVVVINLACMCRREEIKVEAMKRKQRTSLCFKVEEEGKGRRMYEGGRQAIGEKPPAFFDVTNARAKTVERKQYKTAVS